MDKLPGLILTIVVIALAMVLMRRSWTRRVNRDAQLTVSEPSFELGTALWEGELTHLATTSAGEPLERRTPRGLAFRAKGTLLVAAEGIQLQLRGEPTLWIAAARLRGARNASWAIDRGVAEDGLIALAWLSADNTALALESYLRVQDPAAHRRVLDALNQISPSTLLTSSASPTENE